MRRCLAVVIAVLFGLVGVAVAPVTATAATGVTIHRISAPAVVPGAKTTIRPNVSKVGPVKVTKKYFSVYRTSTGKRIVHKKGSATVGAGTYKIKTTVKYKIKKRSGKYTTTRTSTRWQKLTVATTTATCATPADAQTVRPRDTKTTVAQKLRSSGRLDWTSTENGVVHEHWRYTLCDSDVRWVWVTYENGHVSDYWIE